MKLYAMPGTCALSPNIALHWADADFEVALLKRGQHREPDYLAVNPKGQVPALQLDDGRVLTEAAAICLYVADRYKEARLAGRDEWDRARTAEALSFMTSGVHATYGGHFGTQRYADEEACQAEVKKKTYERLDGQYRMLDDNLQRAGGEWYLGERSAADTYLYVLTRWIGLTPLKLEDYPALLAFKARMEEDDKVRQALEAQGMKA